MVSEVQAKLLVVLPCTNTHSRGQFHGSGSASLLEISVENSEL